MPTDGHASTAQHDSHPHNAEPIASEGHGTWTERVIALLRMSRLPLDDDQIAQRLGASQRQIINQTCRRLEASGVVRRHRGADGKIVNSLSAARADNVSPASLLRPAAAARPLLSEDQVKAAIKADLEQHGWTVRVAWGRERGVDIEARRDREVMYLEAKGEAANPPQQVNYFLGALGELIQRMTDPNATYGLALPDHAQYRRLVDRLPQLARDRLTLVVYFVDRSDRTTVRLYR